MRRHAAPAALALLLAACGGASDTPPDAGPADSPAFDAAWRISTHNSYWVNRGVPGDLFASGTGERILDQLLLDHARGVEIDIHKDPDHTGAFLVFHTTPGNVLCGALPDCLAILRAFHRTLPMHEALHVTIELKEIEASIFDATHTIEDLDRVFTDELGALLYRPSDLLARCPGETALGACAKAAGWPATHALRGRIVASILGNWDGLGAQATKDWVDYALRAHVGDRAGFPIASSWQLDHEALNGAIYQLVTQDELDRAYAQSVFLQVEDLADPNVPAFLARRGVIRMDNAVTADDQAARVAKRMQLLQTDTPWIQLDNMGPGEPLRAFEPSFASAMTEPGGRLRLGPAAAGERAFAYALSDANATTTWETVVSSGDDATRVGCLRAATALGEAGSAVTACRTKVPAAHDADGGAGSPDAEQVTVRVETCQDGACDTKEFSSNDPAPGGPGDLLRLVVENSASSCVTVSSSGSADRALEPTWQSLGDTVCFGAPLFYQGLATPVASGGDGAGHFFGTTRDGVEVAAKDLGGTTLLAGE